MKRFLAVLMLCAMLAPSCALAKAKQMNKDVPVWTEESVRQYMTDYIGGKDMSRLYGYYDLQIRRYIPLSAYEAFLTDLEWMTGDFVELGSYYSFAEEKLELKTHVLHLCMEKQDLDLYFTHKDKEDDWEIMALQFVPAQKEARADGNFLVSSSGEGGFTETEITVGSGATPLKGLITMPNDIAEGQTVPACVLVHDQGMLDMNATMGATTFFEDLAHALANMGVASIRYHKRTYTYGEKAGMTAWDETVEDALLAGKLLTQNETVDKERVVLIGHGLGAELAPLIVSKSEGLFTGMLLIGGNPNALQDGRYPESEMAGYDPVKLIVELKLPTLIVQGSQDPLVTEDEGWRLYSEKIGDGITYVSFKSFRGLNHLLMNDLALDSKGKPQYATAATLDKSAGRSLSQWILSLYQTEQEEE